ncbi:uncharacterized protein [Littorina saxatilis]|uniref:uncharacterized protein n=1 Tax=Littorina saxatilis TaxID=31220 RepID=UPI0038B5FF32
MSLPFAQAADYGHCRPASSLKHTCPKYVTGGSDLDCACVTSDAGSPPGKLWWDVTKSAQLLHHNVKCADEDKPFTCQLEWNGTIVTSTSYNLSVVLDSDPVQKAYIRGLATGLGSGLGFGVVVMSVLLAVFCLRRRSRNLPFSSELDQDRERRKARKEVGLSKDPTHPGIAGADQATSGDSSNFYETCDTSQIGLQIPYEALAVKYKPKSSKKHSKKKSAKKNSAFTLDDEGDAYENVTTVQGR